MSLASLARASQLLCERRFDETLAAADEALAGALDADVPPVERGESYDYPERSLAHHCRGTALLELGRRSEAIADLTRAIALDAHNVVARSNRGIARRDEGDVDGAIADFGDALARWPAYAHARANRARLYAARGDWQRAEDDYLVILRVDRASQPARAEWAELRRAQAKPESDAALDALLAVA